MDPELNTPGVDPEEAIPVEPEADSTFSTVSADLNGSDWARYFESAAQVLNVLQDLRLTQLDAYIARLERLLARQNS